MLIDIDLRAVATKLVLTHVQGFEAARDGVEKVKRAKAELAALCELVTAMGFEGEPGRQSEVWSIVVGTVSLAPSVPSRDPGHAEMFDEWLSPVVDTVVSELESLVPAHRRADAPWPG